MDQRHKVILLQLLLFQVLLVASQTDSRDCKFNSTFFKFCTIFALCSFTSHEKSEEYFPTFLGGVLPYSNKWLNSQQFETLPQFYAKSTSQITVDTENREI